MARPRRNFYRKSSTRRLPPKTFKVVCAGCGKELMMTVPPPTGIPLRCMECYKK